MKRLLNRFVTSTLVIAAIPALTGCGSNNPDSAPPGNVVNPLPTTPVAPLCVPITSPIAFTGTGISFDWANILGGSIPADPYAGRNQPITAGTITIAAATTTPTGGPFQRSGVDGTISMNITQNTTVPVPTPYPTMPNTYPGYPYYPGGYQANQFGAAPASATGFVAISQMAQQDIVYTMSGSSSGTTAFPGLNYYPGYNTLPTTTTGTIPCVSGMAIDVGHYYNTIYGGYVYLYMNNTQHGYKLYF